ncbi:low affinity immunoglobulin gamma Fc region receptor II-like isoform X2 [Simochromis diagramma]|uniref:low affinity immunoglobulin gamma Fc region receptor II-like isoform X2 n=1 Tax=Simochromis diagramma TaxID=43689 RepID=UPI001A7ED7BE|nr:low affinity immunoglobulin gamma Fc region receptor II-like isoform X2 [Simochromis diagramma]
MRTSSVALLLGVCVLLLSALTVCAVSLSVSPNLQQFFTAASVSLTCEGQLGSDGWTVKRDTGSATESCGAGGRGFGRINGPSCLFNEFEPVSGVYWCEGEAGEKSEEVNITVSDKEVILESPALPVRTGSDVTLRCKKKTGGTAAAYFYFNGRPVGPTSEHIITINVQQSDEGLYWCSTDEFGSSPQSFLRVKGPLPPTTTTTTTTTDTDVSHPPSPSLPPPPLQPFIIPVVAAVVSLVLVSLVLVLVRLLWKKHTVHNEAPSNDVTYSEVTSRESSNKMPVIQPEMVYSTLRTNTTGTEMRDKSRKTRDTLRLIHLL